jgi:hypothetical protein
LLVSFVLAARSAEFHGWISDAACGWNNARPAPEAKDCAVKCVRQGWAPVFVQDGRMDAFKLSDKTPAMPFIGDHVTVAGELKADVLTIRSLRRSPPPKAPSKPAK